MAYVDNGRGAWVWQGTGPDPGAPPTGKPPSANTAQGGNFLGPEEGGTGQAAGLPVNAPLAAPVRTNAIRPGDTMGSRPDLQPGAGLTPEQIRASAAARPVNAGGAAGAYDASSAKSKAAFDTMHQSGGVYDRVDRSGAHLAAERAANTRWADNNAQRTPLPTAPAAPKTDPGAAGGPAPGAPAAPAGGGYTPQAADYSRYDAAAEELRASRDVFQGELARLSGVDPFGNQAFLQKATDRAVAQAAGTAAGARGGAAAQAGAQRAQVGVQSQLAARGAQEMEQVVARDANQAAQLRLTAAGGMADVSSRLAENEAAFANKAADVGVANLQAATERYGIDANIGQRERESLRSLSVEMGKIDMQRYQTDMQYRMNVDDNIIAKYVSDNALKGVLEQIKAQENISTGEAIMGILGAGAGIAQGVVMKSDRRSKYAISAPKMKDLKEYLGTTKGYSYRYRTPDAPGQRSGDNFGPMAQDLRKTKIGRTVVVEKADGLYVDTGRLALADHGALAALAQRVERLAARVRSKK